MNSEVKVRFLDELLINREVEGIGVSSIYSDCGIAALSRKENDNYHLDLFTLHKDSKEECLSVGEYILSIYFVDKVQLSGFMNSIPSMTAIDLLIFLNKKREHENIYLNKAGN